MVHVNAICIISMVLSSRFPHKSVRKAGMNLAKFSEKALATQNKLIEECAHHITDGAPVTCLMVYYLRDVFSDVSILCFFKLEQSHFK